MLLSEIILKENEEKYINKPSSNSRYTIVKLITYDDWLFIDSDEIIDPYKFYFIKDDNGNIRMDHSKKDFNMNDDINKIKNIESVENGILNTYGDKIKNQFDKGDDEISISLGYAGYFIIDHKERTIFMEEGDIASRMPRMRSHRDQEVVYILPNTTFSLMSDGSFLYYSNKVKNDFYKDYTIIGEKEHENLENNYNNVDKIITNKLDNFEIYMYHGTSMVRYRDIKENGLIPGKGDAEYRGEAEKYGRSIVYLTGDPNVSRRYAIRASGANKWAILKIKITDPMYIGIDEDNIIHVLRYFYYNKKNTLFRYIENNIETLNDYVTEIDEDHEDENEVFKSIARAFENPIRRLLSNYENLNLQELNIIKMLTIRSLLSSHEKTFTYRNIIKPENITLYETGKSKRTYNDGDDDFMEKYRDVVKSIKNYEKD